MWSCASCIIKMNDPPNIVHGFFLLRFFPPVSAFLWQEKQALEKRVSDMEEEIKVSSYTNKLSVWFPLRNNGCIVYLTDVCFSEHSGGTRLSVALQVEAHTYCQFYCQVGLKSKGEKLVTLCYQATSCQAEEEPLLLLPCSIYPSVGVNIVT